MVGPFDMRLRRGGFQRDMKEPLEARIFRDIFGAIGRSIRAAQRRHQLASLTERAFRPDRGDADPGGVPAERALRIWPEVQKPAKRMDVDMGRV